MSRGHKTSLRVPTRQVLILLYIFTDIFNCLPTFKDVSKHGKHNSTEEQTLKQCGCSPAPIRGSLIAPRWTASYPRDKCHFRPPQGLDYIWRAEAESHSLFEARWHPPPLARPCQLRRLKSRPFCQGMRRETGIPRGSPKSKRSVERRAPRSSQQSPKWWWIFWIDLPTKSFLGSKMSPPTETWAQSFFSLHRKILRVESPACHSVLYESSPTRWITTSTIHERHSTWKDISARVEISINKNEVNLKFLVEGFSAL